MSSMLKVSSRPCTEMLNSLYYLTEILHSLQSIMVYNILSMQHDSRNMCHPSHKEHMSGTPDASSCIVVVLLFLDMFHPHRWNRQTFTWRLLLMNRKRKTWSKDAQSSSDIPGWWLFDRETDEEKEDRTNRSTMKSESNAGWQLQSGGAQPREASLDRPTTVDILGPVPSDGIDCLLGKLKKD